MVLQLVASVSEKQVLRYAQDDNFGWVEESNGNSICNCNCNCNGKPRFPPGMTNKNASATATEEAGLCTAHDGEAVMLRSR